MVEVVDKPKGYNPMFHVLRIFQLKNSSVGFALFGYHRMAIFLEYTLSFYMSYMRGL